MLELRPNCERCDKDLPPNAAEARICSFECTFCSACAEGPLQGKCPNCGASFALARVARFIYSPSSRPRLDVCLPRTRTRRVRYLCNTMCYELYVHQFLEGRND